MFQKSLFVQTFFVPADAYVCGFKLRPDVEAISPIEFAAVKHFLA